MLIMAGERSISPERHAELMAQMGLDKPLFQQYFHSIAGVLQEDLGTSLKSRLPVWQEFVPRFQATLELGICAMIFAVLVGIPVGVLAAVKRSSIFDHTAVGISLTGYSMPIFLVGHHVDYAGVGAFEPYAGVRPGGGYGVSRRQPARDRFHAD